jgi:exodeoxyribonuclease-1
MDLTFYDNESTGTSVRFDQITQFGGVTCGADFKVIDEIGVSTRLLPYVVPHPQALAVTGTRAVDLCDPRLPSEYDTARRVGAFLASRKGVRRVFVTYNGIRFDDELIRTMMFRNFQDPWFNSGKDDVKIDLLDVARLVAAFDPAALVVPLNDEGKPTFRLEKICPANGIAIKAHDALGDSVATKELFKHIQAAAPWAIRIALRCGSARDVEALLAEAMAEGRPVFRFTSFGQPDVAPLAVLASDRKRKYVCLDLRADEYPETSHAIAARLYKPDSPFRIIASNKFPLMLTDTDTPVAERLVRWNSLREKSSVINKNPVLRAEAGHALTVNTMEKVNGAQSEELIYEGMAGPLERARMRAFNSARTWQERAQVPFEDARFRDFSARIVLEAVRSGSASLPPEVVRSLMHDAGEAMTRPFAGSGSRHTTIASAIAEGADAEWVDWARSFYGDHPVFDAGVTQAPEPREQMSFAF